MLFRRDQSVTKLPKSAGDKSAVAGFLGTPMEHWPTHLLSIAMSSQPDISPNSSWVETLAAKPLVRSTCLAGAGCSAPSGWEWLPLTVHVRYRVTHMLDPNVLVDWN